MVGGGDQKDVDGMDGRRAGWGKLMMGRMEVAEVYLSNDKNPSCLGYIGDYTTRLSGDYNKP